MPSILMRITKVWSGYSRFDLFSRSTHDFMMVFKLAFNRQTQSKPIDPKPLILLALTHQKNFKKTTVLRQHFELENVLFKRPFPHPFIPTIMYQFHPLLRRAASTLKVQLSRQAARLRGTQTHLTVAFENDGIQGWFAVIPSWPGPHAALAMVDGADTFLDSLSEGNPKVTLELSLNPQNGWHELIRLIPHPDGDGAYYVDSATNHRMWLCGVTEFVFGEMPECIWFQVR